MIAGSEIERRLVLTIELPKLEHGMALFGRIRDECKVFEEKPLRINTEDVTQDIRYIAGYKDALKWVLRQPDEARDNLNRLEGVQG